MLPCSAEVTWMMDKSGPGRFLGQRQILETSSFVFLIGFRGSDMHQPPLKINKGLLSDHFLDAHGREHAVVMPFTARKL